MERLRCNYASLQAMNPRLIYCSMSGWGQEGPYAQWSGHDLNYLAAGGMIGEMNQPQPPGGQIADIGGAYTAVAGITAALYQREKTRVGAYVDISLFESALPFFAATWAESVVDPDARGTLSGKYACYNIYQTRDGRYVSLAALEFKFWENFCMAIERPDLIEDHLAPDRQRYLLAELAQIFALNPVSAWIDLLADADCCFAPVMNGDEITDDPQIRARQALGVRNAVPWMRSPIRIDGDLPPLGMSPALGEHTRAVLREAGFSENEIGVLIKSEAVGE
jgi:crotonobetainyl-CoA:carnitine CoA-transferase CaiB-like acyl-CoA transferase